MAEIKELLEKQLSAFEKFKKANDERLAQLEAKGNTDPLLEEKVNKSNEEIDRLQKSIDAILVKINRPGGTGDDVREEVAEHKAAFKKFLRKGHDEGLLELEQKALNITTDADGGYAIPEELDREILTLMRNESPMRSVCSVRTIGGAQYKKLVSLGGTSSGWVDEDDPRPETNTPGLAAITPFMGEIYANPAATQQMLDDVFFDAEGWLQSEVATEFAEKESIAFLSGDGVKKPKGILAYTSVTTDDATRAFGQLQHMVAAGAAAVTGDELITLIYMLKKSLRNGASWMMNGKSVSAVRKLKDSTGQYLWAPGLQSGQPSSLLGYGIAENEDMADIATGNASILFGNFKRGYLILDRIGIRVLRDPFTNKPYVHFYTTKRVGGMLVDSNAIKILQQA